MYRIGGSPTTGALALLREAMAKRSEAGLNQMEADGATRRFRLALGLAWSAMEDHFWCAFSSSGGEEASRRHAVRSHAPARMAVAISLDPIAVYPHPRPRAHGGGGDGRRTADGDCRARRCRRVRTEGCDRSESGDGNRNGARWTGPRSGSSPRRASRPAAGLPPGWRGSVPGTALSRLAVAGGIPPSAPKVGPLRRAGSLP